MEAPTHDQLHRLIELEVVRAVSANYVADQQDDIIVMTTGGAPKTVVLPVLRGLGRVTVVQRGGSTTTVSVAGGSLINGAATAVISTDYQPLRLKDIGGEYISV